MFDITPIVEAILALVAVIITSIVIPYIKKRTTTEQQKELVAWVKIAVTAAEQIYVGTGRGPEKKLYVVEWLADRNITVDTNQIDALIESAVYDLNNAAVIIEPVAGNMGCVPPVEGYLKGLETVAHRAGALLICDEVINAFRFHYGLYSDLAGIQPDIVTMGKVIGGGFPLAAVGAKAEIMNALAPRGKVYQAGTLSGNPVAVAAAIAVLDELKARPPYAAMATKAAQVTETINRAAERYNVPLRAQRYETVFTPFATTALPIRNLQEAQQSDAALYAKFFHGMLDRGVYFEPSQFEVNFISAAHSDVDVAQICAAVEETMGALAR